MKKALQKKLESISAESYLRHSIVFFLCLFPLVIYLFSVKRFAVNSPYFDDFFWSFGFINQIIDSESWTEQLGIIYSQFNQHRIVYSKLVMLTLFKLTGEINFKTYVWVGNLSLFLLATLINYYCLKRRVNLLVLVPVNFLLFNFSFFHNSILSYGLPNMAVVFFALLAFYLTHRNLLIPALLAGIVATFSNGNGLLTLPIVGFLYLLRGHIRQFLTTLAVSLIVIFVYFQNYRFDTGEVTFDLNTFKFAINFLGGFYEAERSGTRWWFTVLLVTVNLVLWLKVFVKRSGYSDFLLGSFLFIMGTAGNVAVVRAIHNIRIPSWYNQYSLLLFIVFLLFLFETILERRKVLRNIVLFLFTVIGVGNVFISYTRNIPRASHLSSDLRADLMNYQKNNKWSLMKSQMGWSNYHKFNEITHDFVDEKIFRPDIPKVAEWDTIRINSLFSVDSVSQPHIEVAIRQEFHPPSSDTQYFASITNLETLESYFLGVFYKIDHRFFLNPASQQVSPTLFISEKKYFQEAIQKGVYRLALHEISQASSKVYLTDQTIAIDNW